MTLAEGFDLSLFHPLTVVALNIDMHNIYAIIIIFGVLHYNLSEFVFKKTKRRKIVYFSFKMFESSFSVTLKFNKKYMKYFLPIHGLFILGLASYLEDGSLGS